MTVYLDLVILLNYLVDFLLLIGTNRLCGHPSALWRIVIAAGVGSLYGAFCILPGFGFLGNSFWRLVSLLLIAFIAFGKVKFWRKGSVFALLSMALGGIALGLGTGGFWSLVASGVGVLLLCGFGFRDGIGTTKLIPVEIFYGGKKLNLMALNDTGNTLRDPLTGGSVLVVGRKIAQQLTGLTVEQLRDPVSAVASSEIPGLRLIPYKAVGQSSGLLLGMRIKEVRIGGWRGSSMVAFSPDGLNPEDGYQALTGGIV